MDTDIALTEWMRINGYDLSQAQFVRDRLTPLVGAGLDYEDKEGLARVIAEHTSKSVRLPVYSLTRADLGLRIVLRNNFYNWKLSVISEKPIDVSAVDSLFFTLPPTEPKYTGDELHPVYFEGFPDDLIFGYHSANPCRWSAQIDGGAEALWAVVHAVMRSVGAMPRAEYTTEAKHRAALDASTARRKAREAAKVSP